MYAKFQEVGQIQLLQDSIQTNRRKDKQETNLIKQCKNFELFED